MSIQLHHLSDRIVRSSKSQCCESREIAQTSLLLLATLSFLRDLDRVYEHELKRSRAESDKRQVSFANGRDSGESFFRFVIFVLIKAKENEDREANE